MKGEPRQYRCPLCYTTVDEVGGEDLVAYRLTVRPEWALIDSPGVAE
jgi:hypothetical protein